MNNIKNYVGYLKPTWIKHVIIQETVCVC